MDRGAIHDAGELDRGAIHYHCKLDRGAIYDAGESDRGAIHDVGELDRGAIHYHGNAVAKIQKMFVGVLAALVTTLGSVDPPQRLHETNHSATKLDFPMTASNLFLNVLKYFGTFILALLVLAQSAFRLATAFLLSMLLAQHLAFGSDSDAKVKHAVENALPVLERAGHQWIQERGCVSCHRVSFMIWSHNEATARGFHVNRDQVDQVTNWALTNMLAERQEFGGVDTISQMILGRDQGSNWRKKPSRHVKSSDPYETLMTILLERQNQDGSWPPEGQLPTPPEITTGWALLALDSLAGPDTAASEPIHSGTDLTDELAAQVLASRQRYPDCRNQALEYLKTVEPHPTHEGLLLQFLRSELNSQVRAEMLAKIMARQNPDGGWSNRYDVSASDAFATGQTIYALTISQEPIDPTAVERARTFLVDSQQPDGLWNVPPDRMRPGRSSPILLEVISYWGTAWATIGLLHTLPERFVDNPTSTEPAQDSYAQAIRPLLDRFCADCHAPEGKTVEFLWPKTTPAALELRNSFASVHQRVGDGTMPPPDSPQMSSNERQQIMEWIDQSFQLNHADLDRLSEYVVETFADSRGRIWFGTISEGVACYDGQNLTWLSSKDGLGGNTVVSIAEDAQGVLWFGTDGGVTKYDGQVWKTYSTSEGLPGTRCYVLADRQNNIWVGTERGVFRFADEQFSEFKIPAPDISERTWKVEFGKVWCLMQDRHDNIWIARDGWGASRFDGEQFTHFTTKDGLHSNIVSHIAEDLQGNIWFACLSTSNPRDSVRGGVNFFDGKSISKFDEAKGLSANDIYTIYATRSGDVWIGATGVGVYRYDGKQWTLFDKTDRPYWTRYFGLQSMVEDSQGTLWFGFSGGLFRFDGQGFRNIGRTELNPK
ncbi:MAG: hypothetical protein JNL67_19245 [Planctomycetaceae bacterium]|nr:hypothetical protein [Planctomycetaceae bacterium]